MMEATVETLMELTGGHTGGKCETCGYKVRGNDHAKGSHHKAALTNPKKKKSEPVLPTIMLYEEGGRDSQGQGGT